jgi:hypothetical protein
LSVLSSVGSGLATGLIPLQEILHTLCQFHSSGLIVLGNRPEGIKRNVGEGTREVKEEEKEEDDDLKYIDFKK